MQLAVEKRQSLFRSNLRHLMTLLFALNVFSSYSQNSISELLKKYNFENIPYISVQELAMPKTDAILLDAREIKEYKVSHIKNAINVGYHNFDINAVENTIKNKSAMIVVYCSLGIRSETIAERLKKAGYSNVHNLYGGIFEWKNKDFPVYDSDEKVTDSVHAFSKLWSKWLLKGIKVY